MRTGGALIGGLAGAVAGGFIGAQLTAAVRYEMPPGGIQISKPADTVTVEASKILEETEFSITIPWYEKTTTLPKSRISAVRRAGGIRLRVPRSLLYEDGDSRYIDSRKKAELQSSAADRIRVLPRQGVFSEST